MGNKRNLLDNDYISHWVSIGLKRRASTEHSIPHVLLQSIREALWVPETSDDIQSDIIQIILFWLVYKKIHLQAPHDWYA